MLLYPRSKVVKVISIGITTFVTSNTVRNDATLAIYDEERREVKKCAANRKITKALLSYTTVVFICMTS